MGHLLSVVKPRMKRWVRLAVSNGMASARFLGTISPKSIVKMVPSVRPIPTEIGLIQLSATPADSRGPSTSWAIAGSARNPTARLVMVIPTCAPESWVESVRRASWTPLAPASPAAAARSTLPRSTVTKANSAATKSPQIAIIANATSRSSHGVTLQPKGARVVVDAPGQGLVLWGRCHRAPTLRPHSGATKGQHAGVGA